MSLYTHGTRVYAEGVASILDPEKKYFGHRIFTRTDVPDLGSSKSIDRICVGGEADMALVMDDNEDVWRGGLKHLMLVKPYVFFRSGQEVNNAPGDTGDAYRSRSAIGDTPQESDTQLMRCLEVIKSLHREKYPEVQHPSNCVIVEKFVELKMNVLVTFCFLNP
jgi:TFIIF-interacting CTD phosphatase-like protein